MKQNIIIAVVALIAIAGLFLGGSTTTIVKEESLAGTTRDSWTVGAGITTATSTITIENGGTRGGCLKLKQSDGTGYAFFVGSPTGNLATTTSC